MYTTNQLITLNTMKIIILLITSLILNLTVYASNSNAESKDVNAILQTELEDIQDQIFDVDEIKFVSQLQKLNKVIIMDQNFNKIREVYFEKEENLNNQPMLQPFINRSQFITKVDNVSYYVLEKK